MYKFKVILIFFVLQYGFSNALPQFKSYRMASDGATPNVDELNSTLEIHNVADDSNKEIRAFYMPPRIPDLSNDLNDHTKTSGDSPPTKRHRWHFGCHSENTEKNTRSLENFDEAEDNIVLEVRDGPQGQTQQPQPPLGMQQQQPMNMQQQQPMNMQQQPLPMQQQQMPGTMQPMMGGTMQMHPQDGQFHGQYPQTQMPNTGVMGQPPVGYPAQPVTGYPTQPATGYSTQPATGYSTQPATGYPTQPATGYTTQPPAGYPLPSTGYPTATPHNPPAMGWPSNTGNIPYPGTTVPPYNGYPPTGQMQLPIPQNQFTGYGPTSAYTNPVYNTPINPSQNDLEAQIGTAFLFAQLSNMMRDPATRESLLYFINELRSFLSNPNAIPFMRAINHRAQDIMNSPASYNQYVPQTAPHSTSTIVQVQDGANHLLDKLKAKGGTVMSFVKEMANANSRMLEGTTADIPVVNSVVKIGTGLANAGVGMIDGLLSPWLHPTGNSGTTITTVSTPQTTFPNTHYQTPTSITVGK